MKLVFVNTILITIALSCVRNTSETSVFKKSNYNKNSVPERNLILENKPDSIVVVEFYKDTTISILVNSHDSLGKYFYDLGIKRMSVNDFTKAAGEFKTSYSYGFLPASSLAAAGNCFYQMKMEDSALFYANKSLEINPDEFEAKMVKDWLETNKK